MRGNWTFETHLDEIAYLFPQMGWFRQQQLKVSKIRQKTPVFGARAQQILNGRNFARYLWQQVHTTHLMQTAERVGQRSWLIISAKSWTLCAYANEGTQYTRAVKQQLHDIEGPHISVQNFCIP